MAAFKVASVEFDGAQLPGWVFAAFTDAGIDFVAHTCKTRDELKEIAGDADVVWVEGNHRNVVSAENLDVLPRCGAIIRTGSGTDNVPVSEATRLGIVVANTPEAVTDGASDQAIGLLFAVVREIPLHDRGLRGGKWDVEGEVSPIFGQTLGLIGFGHIARRVARKLSGFEMKVLAFDPYVSAEVMASRNVQPASLSEVLAQADFVFLHCPLTQQTFHLIGERELRAMKKTAVLINISRGPVVDEPALVRALTERWIAAAGLDVFEQEPAAPANPLFKLDNVVVTPHQAGRTAGGNETAWRLSVETALDLAQGHWPRSYVNRDVKPRWPLT